MSTVTMTCWVAPGRVADYWRLVHRVEENVGAEWVSSVALHDDPLGNRLLTVDLALGEPGSALWGASEEEFWAEAVDGIDWVGVLVEAPVFAAG